MRDVTFSPKGGLLAFIQIGQLPKIVNVHLNTIDIIPVDAEVSAVQFTDNDGELLLGTTDGQIILWNLTRKEVISKYRVSDEGAVRQLAYNSKNRVIVALLGNTPYIVSMDNELSRRPEALSIPYSCI